MEITCDVAIAGAGIVGAACAEECAAAGLKVVVVEPGPVGGGASAAGMGHIVAMDDSPAQLALTSYSRSLWMARAAELPPELEYVATGTLWVAADEQEMAEVYRKRDVYRSINCAAEVLDARALAEAEPHLRGGLAGALLVSDDAVIYPPCAARYLLEKSGAHRIAGAAASLTGRRIVMRDGSAISAGAVVNATGAWAPELTPGIEIRKRKGHLAITDRYPGWLRHQLVELGYLKSAHSTAADSVAFNVQPRHTGQVLIGSSRQFGDEHPAVDHAILAHMLARAAEYMPGLAALSVIRTWTGFRAATPDKLPLIGPCTSDPHLLLATGHEGLGITTSLATARLIADHILGRTPAIPCAPYLPGRRQEPHA